MIRMYRRYGLSVLLFLSSFGGEAWAVIPDASLRWKVMKTRHFRLYYHQGLYRFALRSARIAEEAHQKLVPYAAHRPQEKTHILILNNTHSANGSATVLPRNVITIFTSPPHARGQLGDTDDWLRVLIYHEYMHVLHLDTMSGVWPILNILLGKSLAPNFLLPLWWIEGWAIYAESAFTGGGRNTSSFFSMFLRASILEKKLLRLDQVSQITSLWPRGVSPYLYGSRFLAYIARRYGKDKLSAFSHAYGGTLLPFAFNLTMQQLGQKSYLVMWEEWLAYERKEVAARMERVKKHPLTRARRLTRGGEWIERPRYLPDGSGLLFYRSDGRKDQRLVLVSRRDGGIRDLTVLTDRAYLALDRDGKSGLLVQPEYTGGIYSYYDIFRLALPSGSLTRLTWAERARDIDLSPDGRWAVYVKQEVDQHSLWRFDLATKQRRLLYRPPRDTQISSPRLSPDGRSIVMSVWQPGGHRDIWLWEIEKKALHKLTQGRAQDIEPCFSPDGKEILFASDRDGIYNLYGLSLPDRHLRRISNEYTGAFSPEVSPDGRHLAFLRYHADGFDLYEMPYPPRKMAPYPLPTTASLRGWPTVSYPPSLQLFPVSRYTPWSTLAPLNWAPMLGGDLSGLTLGFRLSGSDILAFHRYEVSASLNLGTFAPAYALSYDFTRFLLGIRFRHGLYDRMTRFALYLDGRETAFAERVIYNSLSLDLPWRSIYSLHLLSLRYDLDILLPLEETTQIDDPAARPPRYPRFGAIAALTLSYLYTNTRRFGYSVSSEIGRTLRFDLQLQHPYLGGIAEAWIVQGSWSEYIPMPWAQQHVLALHLEAGIGRSRFRERPLFVLGGLPVQDILQAAIMGFRASARTLRGYAPFSLAGDTYGLWMLEYRFPIIEIERGIATAPLFLRRLYGAFFCDGGVIFSDMRLRLDDLRIGVGVELRADIVLGYGLPFTLRAGFAKGLTAADGIDQLYLVLGNAF